MRNCRELAASAYADELREARAVRGTIENLMLSGHKDIENRLKYEDFAVIARNKYAFSQIESEFENGGIPFFYKRTQSGIACETDCMKAFDLALRLLLMNPMDLYHRQMLRKLASQDISADADCAGTEKPIGQLLHRRHRNTLKCHLCFLSGCLKIGLSVSRSESLHSKHKQPA
jgi:hypothetical protein